MKSFVFVGALVLIAVLIIFAVSPAIVRAGDPTLDAAMYAIMQATARAQQTRDAREQEQIAHRATATAVAIQQAQSAAATWQSLDTQATRQSLDAAATRERQQNDASATQSAVQAEATRQAVAATATADVIRAEGTRQAIAVAATAEQIRAEKTRAAATSTAAAVTARQEAEERDMLLQSATRFILMLIGLGAIIVGAIVGTQVISERRHKPVPAPIVQIIEAQPESSQPTPDAPHVMTTLPTTQIVLNADLAREIGEILDDANSNRAHAIE